MDQKFSRRSVLGYAAGSAAGAVLLTSAKPSQAAPMKFKADTAAHFHGPAEVGKNAAPAVWISEKGQNLASPFKGTATLTDAQADDLLKGLWYANVHTEANKGGEIRGQVVKG